MKKNEMTVVFASQDGLNGGALQTFLGNADIFEKFGLKLKKVESDVIPSIAQRDPDDDSAEWADVRKDGHISLYHVTFSGKKKAIIEAKKFINFYVDSLVIVN